MVAYYDAGGGGGDAAVPRVNIFESAIVKLGCVAEELGSLAQSSAGTVAERLLSELGSLAQSSSGAVAERLLSESMDRLAIIAKDVSDLAAVTAIDLALIEAKRGKIDRAQAENRALLRELTEQAQ